MKRVKDFICYIIKIIAYYTIECSGIIFLLIWMNRKLFGNQIIILYTHRVIDKSDGMYSFLKTLNYFTVDEFERKIRYLSRHYKFISLQQAMKYLKHGNMPKNCIVLTLDDGYRCNYHKVFPILKKCTIPATIFISTEAINSNAVLWHDKLIYAIGHTNISEFKIPELSDEIYRMKSTKDRNDVFTDVCRLLKQCEESEREVSLVKLMKTLEINVEEIENINLMLTWDEIREMHSSGLISFGSHTLSHSILTKVSKEKAQKEIYDSKKDIEEHLGEKLSYFSYPNGQYNLTIENIVKSAGYECAFSTNGKIRNNRADYYTFGRKGFVSEPFVFFSLSVAGVLDLIRGFIQDFNKVHPWMISYSLQKVKSLFLPKFQKKTHILLCICDHFEPLWKDADKETGLERVKQWCEKYSEIARKYKDSEGCQPKHTFFYPIEEYVSEHMKLLAELCHQGYGEVEIHLHHDNDTADNLQKSILDFKKLLFNKYKLLAKDKESGEIKYGFIHGNWALDNSRPDGRNCGINNEIQVLQDTGCYADFTMPSAPDVTQTTKINSIYYARGKPQKSKSHNFGVNASKGKNEQKGLLMIQGPLMLNWKKRKLGIFPHIENSDFSCSTPVSLERIKLWIKANIHVKKQPEYLFIKLYTHGCQEKNSEYLLNEGLDKLFSCFQNNFKDVNRYKLHYVSAREMVNIMHALEDNVITNEVDINKFRDFRFVMDKKRKD